ncbi:MAG: virulence factor [Pseudomonadota bacterium]
MPNLTIVYWRDMPAQVIVGKGRRAAKAPLPERFEQAIDRCAMRVGARDDDAYMAGFRKVDMGEVNGDPAQVAQDRAAQIDAEYDKDRIHNLIANDGWAETPSTPQTAAE